MIPAPTSLPFTLRLETGERLRVLSFRGREAVSKPFRFDVDVVADDALGDLLGRRATLELHGEAGPLRRIHGLVDAASVSHHDSERVATLRLVPRLARLRRRRTRRVFQDRTTVEIAAAILAEWQLPLRAVVARDLPKRAYSVQYDESDLAYLARLFAEDGLFFGFDHAEDAAQGDVLLIADRPDELASPDGGSPRLVFRPTDDGRGPEDTVFRLERRLASTVRHARVRGYDHRRPMLTMEDSAGPASLETFDEDEGSYEDDLPLRPARVRLEAEAARAYRFEVATHCRRLEPLRRLLLDEAGGELVVTAVRHEGYGGERLPDGKRRYQSRATLLPASATPRPARRPPKPRQVSETATVVGPPGSEIHMDEQGRIKVRFHWDREAKGDETSSCWLRVLTPWAGAGWGVQFTPRLGMEVLVTFIGGDVDRPVCAGALVNATHPMPFGAELSGIRTQSTPGGGNHNELSFDDHRGAERLILHAARDMHEHVGHVQEIEVGAARNTTVQGPDALRVGGARDVDVGGGRATRIAGDDRLAVGGAWDLEIGGSGSVVVLGNESRLVAGDRIVEVRGDSTVIVGSIDRPAHREDVVHGSHAVSARDGVTVRSQSSILLQCGESSIELLPDRLVLRSPALQLGAGEQLSCGRDGGPTLSFGAEAELVAKALRIFTERGALELDTEFRVKGDALKLGYDPSRPRKKPAADGAETELLRLRLSNEKFEPLANCTYHLTVDGLRFEGVTGGDGSLDQPIPEGSRKATLRVWERAYPNGPQTLYSVRLGDLAPRDTLEGTRARLANLAYFAGAVDETPKDEELEDAIRAFQGEHADTHDLEVDGQPTSISQGAIADVEGS